jgi:glycosyltransferase involved in cell wall biosynthesis
VAAVTHLPLVSILTPSYNQAAFLEATIRSVEEQDYEPVEHVVVDGGSTDGSVDILRRRPGVRWISEPDEGQSHALNKALSLANGEIVGWLNSDDVYLPGAIARGVAALERTGAALVYANLIEIDESGREVGRQKARGWDRDRLLRHFNSVPQPTVFMRREALDAVGGIDASYHYAMDYELWLRLGARFPVAYVDDWWAAFRHHPAAKTGSRVDERFWAEAWRASRKNGGPLVFSDSAFEAIRSRSRLLGSLHWRLLQAARKRRA